SGPATVGRDLRKSADQSTSAIVQWLILIGIAGLLLFYRAPFLVVVQLVNTAVSVVLVMGILAHLARWNVIDLFAGLENYAIVVLAGISLMMGMLYVARENEIRVRTPTLDDAVTESLRLAGPILVSGGFILLLGWGMLAFTQFGKFQQLGGSLAIGAVCGVVSSLTLLPALLSLLGRWALWPNLRTERISADRTWGLARDPWSRVLGSQGSTGLCKRLWQSVEARPQTLVVSGLLGMTPFLLIAVVFFGHLNYGLLSQLPDGKPSVKGAMIIQDQFPAGSTGPVTLLIKHPDWDFSRLEGQAEFRKLSDALEREKNTFRVADMRSVIHPLGIDQKDVGMHMVLSRMFRSREAVEYFVGDKTPEARHATKLEIVFDDDPFSRESIQHFEKLRQQLPRLLPDSLKTAEWHLLGAPASIRDLKTVTDRDRLLIQSTMILSVFVCLVLLLRRWLISLVLVALGGFNYLTALGATFAVYWLTNSVEFEGLDWKVAPFLFTILFVVGTASYGMLFVRICEEQDRHGPTEGLRLALERQGNVLLGSGLILGGLFASLLAGSLASLKQLGFGLACGALVDALLIRPVLIPACLLLLLGEQTETNPASLSEPDSELSPQKNLKLTVPPDLDA
ncbi:MAG: MMPL family transporter, partial [Planctomycetaceae bacterium]|nr:MMPL family transporter [Planctomycetaceae bacterium]